MRRIWAILISVVFLHFFIGTYFPTLPEFGNIDMYRRVSFDYISKSTTTSYQPVEYKKSKGLEDGSANVVTSIVVNYRSFDTLGEVTVLFAAALGVGILANIKKRRIEFEEHKVLSVATGMIFPLILVFGTYVFVHGHLTPGGGFPGGTVIALGFLLLMLAKTNLSHRCCKTHRTSRWFWLCARWTYWYGSCWCFPRKLPPNRDYRKSL